MMYVLEVYAHMCPRFLRKSTLCKFVMEYNRYYTENNGFVDSQELDQYARLRRLKLYKYYYTWYRVKEPLLYIFIIQMYINIYSYIHITFSHRDREVCDEFLERKEILKLYQAMSICFEVFFRVFLTNFSIDRVFPHLKGSEFCVGLFLVPDYPILAARKESYAKM